MCSDKAPLVLIDAYSQIYRGFYALRALSTSDGRPSNAVFAMAKALFALEREHPTDSGAFVFDKGKPAVRIALAPQYKANRPPMPEELRSQMPVIRELVAAFGWPALESEGIEADDLIAVVAKKFPDRKTLIVSSDKDISQIIDSRVSMLVPDREGKGFVLRSEAETFAKFGVRPDQIVDYLSLIGDASDNIPGVEGVGPKTAASLLADFGSIDGIFAGIDKIKRPALREKLSASREILELNRKLIKLECEPPPGFVLQPGSIAKKPLDADAVRAIAESMELKSILRDLEKLSGLEAPPAAAQNETKTQMEFFF